MPKRAEITSEDEYQGWLNVLHRLENDVTTAEMLARSASRADKANATGRLAAATKARDALLPAIRRWQQRDTA